MCSHSDDLTDIIPRLVFFASFYTHPQFTTEVSTQRDPLVIIPATSSRCPKCGTTKKSGQSSCCARDGAWFKNCGNVGDTQFDHTWAEGVQACKHFDGLKSVKSAPQGMLLLHQNESIAHMINNTQWRHATQHQTTIYRRYSVYSAGNICHEDHVAHVKTTVYICVVFVISHLQS